MEHNDGRSGPGPPLIPVGSNGRINCLKATYFHPVREAKDLYEPQPPFQPLFVHHFFGLREEIAGFSELRIQIFYAVDTFDTFVKVTATLPPEGAGGPILRTISTSSSNAAEEEAISGQPTMQYDDPITARIVAHLSRVPFPGGFHPTEESFLSALRSERRRKFLPHGECVGTLPVNLRNESTDRLGSSFVYSSSAIDVYQSSFEDTRIRGEMFRLLHRRIEWFLHFFIDACSNIDQDHRWTVLLPYATLTRRKRPRPSPHLAKKSSPTGEPLKRRRAASTSSEDAIANKENSHDDEDGDTLARYELVGIVTLYNFFALPLGRKRVSQFLVFPYLQGRNIGMHLLDLIFRQTLKDPEIGEITVEDPAPSFRQLRDVVGLRLACSLGVITEDDLFPPQKEAHGKRRRASSLENLPLCNSEFKKHLGSQIKESKGQVGRLAEILSLAQLLPETLPPLPPRISTSAPLASPSSRSPSGVRSSAAFSERRDWRVKTSCASEKCKQDPREVPFHESNVLKEVRVKIKRRICLEKVEEYGSVASKEQRNLLSNAWTELYTSYYRTIRKLRDLMNHTKNRVHHSGVPTQ